MVIELKNISKIIGNTKVLDSITMYMESGKIYGFQGMNGCGKTMLMRMIAGLIYPTNGRLTIDGVPVNGADSFPNKMGLLIENPSFLDSFSGYANLKMLAQLSEDTSDAKIIDSINRVGLGSISNVKYKKYSLGMRQRLGVACAIMDSPDLLILDEPFNSIDEEGIKLIRQVIAEEKRRGALIIVTCHDYDILCSISDEVCKMIAGKIVKRLIKLPNGQFTGE